MADNSNNDKAEVVMVDDTALENTLEKGPTVREIDSYQVLGLSQEDTDFYNSFTPAMRKKMMHKIDRRLIPMLTILYLISHLDRSNIGNTKIEGIEADLGISGIEWNLLLSLFFVPYIAFEIPSNILLKRFMRPSLYIGILVTTWGVVMTCHGVVTNYAGIMCLRLLLGVLEAGFFPAAVFLTTFWYMPRDLASRISWFYCTSALSGAFSGLLAAGIAKMDGVGGYEGWRWIFIMEGLVTVVIGVSTFFLLVDTPERAGKWLKPEETRFLILQRFIKQGGQFAEGETKATHTWWTDLKAILLNWRLWFINWMSFCQTSMSNATKFNLPTIVKTMGFTNTNAQLMTAPPYVAAAILVIVVSKFSDRIGWRMPFVVGPFAICCVGFSIMLGLRGRFEEELGGSYTACVIAVLGIYASTPSSTSWAAANIAPASRRAVGVAMTIAFGNLGGIMGSYIFMNSEAPVYATGFGLSLALGASGIIAAFCAEAAYKWGNTKKARMTEEEVYAMYTQDQLLAMGEKNPLFKYTL